MPLASVTLIGPRHDDHVGAVLAGVRAGIESALAVPADRVTVTASVVPAAHVSLPPGRSDRFVLVDITLYEGRDAALKSSCTDAIRERLASDPGITPGDVAVVFRDVTRTDLAIEGPVTS